MFKKLLTAVALVLALVIPVGAISDVGRPEISRLWVNTDSGDKFACTATYIQPYLSDRGSWLVSAGHCSIANTLARNQSMTIRAGVNWRGVINTHGEYGTKTIDIALATVPDVRDGDHKRIWLADKAPETGRVYIHGFPQGIEEVDMGIVAPEEYNATVSLMVPDMTDGYPQLVRKNLAELFPGLRFMVVKHDRITGGSSGSPILGDDDRLVGILWGGIPYDARLGIEGLPSQFEGWDIILFTPVERVHDLFKSIGVDG